MTNRVAGFICKYVFSEHESCVTSLVVIEKNQELDSTYVVCVPLFIPPAYEVYRGYMVFAFSVTMFVCL